VDELVSRTAGGHGNFGGWVCAVLGFFFPVLATPWFTSHLGRYEFSLTSAQPLAALVVVVVTAINYFSVRMSGVIQVVLTSLKIATILLIVVGGGLFGAQSGSTAASATGQFSFGTIGALLTALVPAMWAYNGFNDLGELGEEILRPHKNIRPDKRKDSQTLADPSRLIACAMLMADSCGKTDH
jgi:amino acid transporter